MKGMAKTKFIGVYRYVSDTKRFEGKPDECFYYSYRDEDKKFRWHKVGWRSEKVTAQYAADKRSEFMIASILYQVLRLLGKQVVAFDTDPVNATLAGFKEFEVACLDILKNGDIDPRQFDALIDAIMEQGPETHVSGSPSRQQ